MSSKQIIVHLVILSVFVLGGCAGELQKESEAALVAQDAGGMLFENKCGNCHSGAIPKAPRMEALKLLTEEAIVASLQTGMMRAQGASLTAEQHQQIAAYITRDSVEDPSLITGMCASSEIEDGYRSDTQIVDWGLGAENLRFVDAENLQINAGNVGQLGLQWIFAFPNSSRARAQPTIVGNTLFTANQHGLIYALDRSTGCIRWTFQADTEVRSALTIAMDEGNQASRMYFSDFNAQVYALDLSTRELLWKVKIDDHPAATITGSLSLFEDQVFAPVSSLEIVSAIDTTYQCCSFRGAVVSLDKESGAVNWKTHTIKEPPTEHGKNSIGVPILAPSGAPVWSRPTIDVSRRLLYVGTGENYSRPASKTSDAIIAMSVDSGQIAWVKQAIPRDAWNGACMIPGHPNCPEDTGPDADFGAPPMLITAGSKDIILAGQKSGTVYALDPDNEGAFLWEKTVGRGGIMGGVHWGMASDGHRLYVPINDQGSYQLHENIDPAPGLHALRVEDGASLWSTIEQDRCVDADWSCGPGISAAITATPDVIFAGTLDGIVKAYASADGKELWSFDTKKTFESVNKVHAFGGTIDSDGPIVVENQLFITSGYAKFNEKAGNVLLAFEVSQQNQ